MSPYDKREAGAVWNAILSPILVQSRKVLLCGKSLGRNQNMFNLFMVIFLIVLGFLLYGKSLSIPYYGNDFQFVFINPSIHNALDSFSHPVPYTQTYRPVQSAIMQVVQAMHGMNTLPIHILSLLIHILIAIVIFTFMTRQKFSAIQSGIAAIFMVIAPINVMTVAGNDSLHQLLGTLLGILSVMILIRREQSTSSMARLLMFVGSVLLFCMAIFSGETAIVFSVPILAVLMYQIMKNPKGMSTLSTSNSATKARSGRRFEAPAGVGLPRRSWGRVFIALPYLLILFIYGYIYYEMIPQMSGTWVSPIGISRHTVINSLMIAAGSIYPFSTVRLANLFFVKSWMTMSILGSTAIALVMVVITGWLQSTKRSYITALLLIIMAMTLLLGLFIHPSELIVYTIMPFVAVIIGLAVGTMVERIRVIPSTRLLFGAFVVMVALSCCGSTMQKVRQMGECGERYSAIVHQFIGTINTHPEYERLLLVNPITEQRPYSVFVCPGFAEIAWSWPYIIYRCGKKECCDLPFTVIEVTAGDDIRKLCWFGRPENPVLTLHNNTVVDWR